MKNVVAKVTANFGGIVGPVTCEVGLGTDIDAFLLSFTASSGTPTKGLVNGDLGVELASATRAHPNGYFATSGNPTLQIKLTSASGNLNGMNAGSVTVVVEYEFAGP